jgi:hypothetical protein
MSIHRKREREIRRGRRRGKVIEEEERGKEKGRRRKRRKAAHPRLRGTAEASMIIQVMNGCFVPSVFLSII